MGEINKKVLIAGGVILALALLVVVGRQKLGSKKVVMENKSTGEKMVVENKGEGECPAGSYVDYGQGRYEVIGKEKYQFDNNKEVELCCGQGQGMGGQKSKYCYGIADDDQDYTVIWTANDETGGKYQKYMESYPKDGKVCTRIFGEQEKVVMKSCE